MSVSRDGLVVTSHRTIIEEEHNGVYYQSLTSEVQALEEILVNNGVNMVRQRVWTSAGDGDYGIDYTSATGEQSKGSRSDVWPKPSL